MTKPSKNKPSSQPKAASAEAKAVRKDAAAPGVIASRDVGQGTGAGAAITGSDIRPADSSLLGQASKDRPAAAPKAQGDSQSGSVPLVEKEAAAASTQPKPAEAKPTDAKPTSAKSSEPKPRQTTPQSPPPSVVIRKHGFWPVVLGGVVAAGVGAGATVFALPHLPASWIGGQATTGAELDPDAIKADAVSAARQAAQDVLAQAPAAQTPDDLRSAIEAQDQRLTALETAEPATPAGEADNADAISKANDNANDEALAEIRARLDQQAEQIAALTSQGGFDPETAQRIQALADQAQVLEQQIASAAERAQAQISAAQAEATKLQEAAADSTKRAEAIAAIGALQAALDRGVSGDAVTRQLADAGVEAPEALTRDIPGIESLQQSFAEASRAALRASLRSGDSGGNALTNFLKAQTGARSITPREGNDPDAILSRANAKVEAGDIVAALDDLTTLPDAARQAPAMADWLAGAEAYRNAHAALSDLSAATE